MDPDSGKVYDSMEAARADGVADPVPLGDDPVQAERVAAAQREMLSIQGFLSAYQEADRARRLGPKPVPVPAEVRAARHRARVAVTRRRRS